MSCFNIDSECPDPTDFENGNVFGDSYVVGSTIKYSCKEGFILSGNATRSCHADRKWSGKQPVCELGCSSPSRDFTSFHTLEGTGFPVGTKTTYECRFGYKISGNPEIECLKSYKWSEPDFACIKLSCGTPTTPANGYIEGTDSTFGSWITYHCEKGFVIDDPQKTRRYCSSTGTWSSEPRTCSKIKCPAPIKPENGFVTSHDAVYEFRSIVNYYCDQGFELVGSSKGECNEDGNWGAVPTCTVDVNCNFDGLSNALCGYTNEGTGMFERHFIEEKTLSGYPSYVLRATSKPAVLLSPALLSGDPYCFKFHYYIRQLTDSRNFVISSRRDVIAKIRPKEKKNRWLNQQVTVMPHEFFESVQFEITLKGKNTKIDLDDFSLANGKCESSCGGDTCLHDGVCIDRIGTYTCICTRYYRGDNCEIEILCPPVPEIPFGKAKVSPDPNKLSVGTKVRYTCNEGYLHVSGPKSIVCNNDGTWSIKKNPVCQEILCPRVGRPSGGLMTIESVDGNDAKMSIGTIIRFTCPVDKYLEGSATTIVCLRNGKWSDGNSGTCKDKEANFEECPKQYRKRGPICYKEYKRIATYAVAQSKCSINDAKLTTIQSEAKRLALANLLSRNILYHIGLDDIGQKTIKWANGASFVKIESGEYSGNFKSRENVTDEARCGTFLGDIQRSEISVSTCEWRRRYMCEILPMSVTAVSVTSNNERLTDVVGVYRPLIGVIHADSLVYKKDSSPIVYLYRWTRYDWSGWTIGDFDIQVGGPIPKRDVVKVMTDNTLPQFFNEQWLRGSMFQELEGSNISVEVRTYDQWEKWTNWSPCTRTCGGGDSLRTRNCAQPGGARGHGDCRGLYLENKTCGQKQCIITRWQRWSPWSNCSSPCGTGEQSRNRTCIKDPLSSDECDGPSEENRKCNEQDCISPTSEWFRSDRLEYKIVHQSSSNFIAKEDCENVGGKLAKVNSIDLLRTIYAQIINVHCGSSVAFFEWNLWAIYRNLSNIGRDQNLNSSTVSDIKKSEIVPDSECHTMRHICNEPGISWMKKDCKTYEATGYVCQRVILTEWKPCNHNPCNTGNCTNLGGEKYECTCSEHFEGKNCETALQCNIEEMVRKYNVSYASTMLPVDDTYVWKDVEIQMTCKREGQATIDNQVFKCIGLNTWNVKRSPAIDCGNTCVLPELGSNIVAKHEGEEVLPGAEFAPGVLLVFECPKMMRIVGEPLAACDEDGWDVTLPDECEFTFPCKKISEPSNGKLEIHPKFQEDVLKTGTKATLICDSGFVIWGEEIITCNKNGHWSNEIGECQNVPGCEIKLDELQASVTAFDLSGKITKNTLFRVGQTIYLRCVAKGRKATIKAIKCAKNREWSTEISTYCS
uniref:uncharacterized protein LOC120344144 isoform X1 n=1 Tax=Styela clava TaxID=7725 RepID=UPI001939E1F1|nr:uncharacterized protein LOC120344144 isoform X1 [Styela clava]XP_039269168.1 uncharacterized protein LOC120344144 isoform X2 [Styela clava]